LHVRFLGIIDLANATERIEELASLISQLPVPNYSLLRALTAHLILIVQNAHINKMTMRNVGIVFSPTLGIPAGVFSLMLGEFERVFNVNADSTDRAKPSEETLPYAESEVSNRNSRSYADGAADRLLGLSGRKLKTTEEESDEGDDDIPDSSGTDTENEAQDTSPPDTPGPNTYSRGLNTAADSSPTCSHTPHSANVAAQRGLQVSVATPSNRRASGLPASPRPPRMPINAAAPGSPGVFLPGSPSTTSISGGR